MRATCWRGLYSDESRAPGQGALLCTRPGPAALARGPRLAPADALPRPSRPPSCSCIPPLRPQINPAVSLALALTGNLGPLQAAANAAAQVAGAILGAGGCQAGA